MLQQILKCMIIMCSEIYIVHGRNSFTLGWRSEVVKFTVTVTGWSTCIYAMFLECFYWRIAGYGLNGQHLHTVLLFGERVDSLNRACLIKQKGSLFSSCLILKFSKVFSPLVYFSNEWHKRCWQRWKNILMHGQELIQYWNTPVINKPNTMHYKY